MISEISYINIREALSRVMRHPLLQDVTLEQAVQYTIDFLGMPKLFEDREETIHIDNLKWKFRNNLKLHSRVERFITPSPDITLLKRIFRQNLDLLEFIQFLKHFLILILKPRMK